jgi:hypothetical protein
LEIIFNNLKEPVQWNIFNFVSDDLFEFAKLRGYFIWLI